MKFICRYFILICLLYFGDIQFSNGQNKTDSLLSKLNTTHIDSSKVILCNEISREYIISDPFKAMEYALKALEISRLKNYLKGVSSSYFTIGNIYFQQTNYVQSLESYLKGLKIAEQIKDKISIAQYYSSIGLIYFYRNNFENAIDYYEKSLELCKETNAKHLSVIPNYNIGLVHEYKKDFANALKYYSTTLTIAKLYRDNNYAAMAYNGIGAVYEKQNKTDLAREYYQRSLNIRTTMGDKYGYCTSYNSIGSFFYQLGDYNKAIEYFQKTLKIASQYKYFKKAEEAALKISQSYNALKIPQKAYDYLLLHNQIADSSISNDNYKKISQLELQMEFENKQKAIELEQQKKEYLKEIELGREKFIKNLLFVVVLLMFSLVFFIFILYRNKNKANKLLGEQKESINLQKIAIEEKSDELERQKLAILSQHEIIEIQRDLATKQRDQIIKQNAEITDSIAYASRIQKAMLPPEVFIEAVLTEFFIIYKPRDIVSGDFYWLSYNKKQVILAVADCTGHGVPASFMSILGISLLKGIVLGLDEIKANVILNELRMRIITILHQTGKFGGSQDGMDIALCVIDFNNHKLQFAGANNPIYHLKFSDDKPSPELIKILPDKMPIGIHANDEIPFKNQEFKISSGDILYMFTDGYIDQFGGEEGKKFMSKNLRSLIIDIYHKPMQEQKEILWQTFENWRNFTDEDGRPYEQVDDVLLFAVKI